MENVPCGRVPMKKVFAVAARSLVRPLIGQVPPGAPTTCRVRLTVEPGAEGSLP